MVWLLLAAVAVPAPLGPPATPEHYTSYAARPEWYVLPLHGLLGLAQRINPGLAFIGTVVIPGLAVAWLLALPCSTGARMASRRLGAWQDSPLSAAWGRCSWAR